MCRETGIFFFTGGGNMKLGYENIVFSSEVDLHPALIRYAQNYCADYFFTYQDLFPEANAHVHIKDANPGYVCYIHVRSGRVIYNAKYNAWNMTIAVREALESVRIIAQKRMHRTDSNHNRWSIEKNPRNIVA